MVLILAIIAALAANRLSGTARATRIVTAEADLHALRQAFLDPEHGYIHDLGGIPGFSPAYLRVGNLLVATNVFGTMVMPGNAFNTQFRGIRVDEGTEAECKADGRALPSVFTEWDEDRRRGWHGPYLNAAIADFPDINERRFSGDLTFGERGFFPRLDHLRLPSEFKDDTRASIYGFVGEPVLMDPWGNPYVVQIPPPQAFGEVTNVSDQARFAYGRIVSAGPDGVLDTPCFGANTTNFWGATGWNERKRRLSRQAGLIDVTNRVARGDDLVLFFSRNDIDEGEEK